MWCFRSDRGLFDVEAWHRDYTDSQQTIKVLDCVTQCVYGRQLSTSWSKRRHQQLRRASAQMVICSQEPPYAARRLWKRLTLSACAAFHRSRRTNGKDDLWPPDTRPSANSATSVHGCGDPSWTSPRSKLTSQCQSNLNNWKWKEMKIGRTKKLENPFLPKQTYQTSHDAWISSLDSCRQLLSASVHKDAWKNRKN